VKVNSLNPEQDYLFSLGERIKRIRKEKKLSQTEVAYRCGFDKSNYNTIEKGKRNITILNLLKIAEVLEVNINAFFDE
jgi:transcriptional regulator with XRE-family HTH domain